MNEIVHSDYYKKVVELTCPAVPMEKDHSAQQAHLKHLIGHLLYVEDRIKYLQESALCGRSWRPLQVLNEIRSATLYLYMIHQDIQTLWKETYGAPKGSNSSLVGLFTELYDLMKSLFPFPLERKHCDIFIVLPNGETKGPVLNVYLQGMFADTWNSLIDLCEEYHVPSDKLIEG